ncbi:MAG: tetratricopeptide repeat protein [Planctomycetaceae bacterium]|nr:tetratricopeptide repeat protein [Planctomycetaceae bacterium]
MLVALVAGAWFGRKAWRSMQAEAARERGMAAAARRDWKAALPDLSTAVVANREDAELLLVFAEARRRVPKLEGAHLRDAAGIYRTALSAGAPREETLVKLLAVLMDSQQFVEAADVARQILDIDPTDPAALEALVGTLLLRGKYTDAITLLDDAIRASPADIGLRTARIDAMTRSGAKPGEVLAFVDAWIAEPGSPRVLRDLRAAIVFDELGADAVTLDPPFDEAWKPATADEARYRSRLLVRLGRIDDACRALEAGRQVAADDLALVREDLRYRFFAGRTDGLEAIVDGIAAAAAPADPDAAERAESLKAALRCALVVARGDRDAAIAALEGYSPEPSTIEAEWRSRLLESFRSGAVPRALRVGAFDGGADPLLVAVYDMRRARMLADAGDAGAAAAAARDAYLVSEGQWRPAALLMIRTLLDSGRFGEAAAGARQFARQSGGDPELRVLALEAESKMRLAGLAAGRDVKAFLDELRQVLADRQTPVDGRRVAIEGLFIGGAREEAREAAKALMADPSLGQADARTIARIGDGLGRSLQDPSPARLAAEKLRAVKADPWLIAEVDAVAAELADEPLKGLDALLAAAGGDRTNIAKAGLYADRLVADKAAAIFERSLPEGATATMTSRVVATNPGLARKALEALEKQGGGLPYAFGLLRMTLIDPTGYPMEKSLLVAEEVRRENPNDPQLLVVMAEVFAAAKPPNIASAVELMRQAFRLDVSRLDYLGRALLLAQGDQSLLASLAEELLGAAGGDVVARRLVVAALCDAGQVQRAADSAIRIAEVTGLDEDVALAGRTLAMSGDLARSERLLETALSRSGSWPLTLQTLATVQKLLGKVDAARETLRLAGGVSDPVERALDSARLAEESGNAADFALALDAIDAKEPRVAGYLRDVALRRGTLSAVAIGRIESSEGKDAAARVRLAVSTYSERMEDIQPAEALARARAAKDDWAGWIAAIRVAQRKGDPAVAAGAATEALAALPRELRLGVDAIAALTDAGRFKDAERAASTLLSIGALEPSLREAAARLETARGDGAKAILQLDAIVDPAAKGRTRELRAQAFALRGDMKAAVQGGSEASLLRIAPMLESAPLAGLLAELEMRPGVTRRMIAEIAALVAQRAPQDKAASEAASRAARAVLSSDEKSPEALAAALTAALASGDAAVTDAARTAFLASIQGADAATKGGQPANGAAAFAATFALNNEADALRNRGASPERAVELARRALVTAPAAQKPSVETTLARCLVASGKAAEGLELARAGAATPTRLLAEAEALAALGRRNDAEGVLARAREMLQSTPYASRRLAEAMSSLSERVKAMPVRAGG